MTPSPEKQTAPGHVLLEASNLTRILPAIVPVTLVQDVSFQVGEAEFVAITGPSGSGKSSLLYLLGLLDRPTSGEVRIDGLPTHALTSAETAHLRLEKLGFVHGGAKCTIIGSSSSNRAQHRSRSFVDIRSQARLPMQKRLSIPSGASSP